LHTQGGGKAANLRNPAEVARPPRNHYPPNRGELGKLVRGVLFEEVSRSEPSPIDRSLPKRTK